MTSRATYYCLRFPFRNGTREICCTLKRQYSTATTLKYGLVEKIVARSLSRKLVFARNALLCGPVIVLTSIPYCESMIRLFVPIRLAASRQLTRLGIGLSCRLTSVNETWPLLSRRFSFANHVAKQEEKNSNWAFSVSAWTLFSRENVSGPLLRPPYVIQFGASPGRLLTLETGCSRTGVWCIALFFNCRSVLCLYDVVVDGASASTSSCKTRSHRAKSLATAFNALFSPSLLFYRRLFRHVLRRVYSRTRSRKTIERKASLV